MLFAEPQTERHTPFLQARAKILGAVDRVQDGDPAFLRQDRGIRVKALLADEMQRRKAFAKPTGDKLFEKLVGLRDRASVRLPVNVMATFQQVRQHLINNVPNPLE